jgi:hypothetical protein
VIPYSNGRNRTFPTGKRRLGYFLLLVFEVLLAKPKTFADYYLISSLKIIPLGAEKNGQEKKKLDIRRNKYTSNSSETSPVRKDSTIFNAHVYNEFTIGTLSHCNQMTNEVQFSSQATYSFPPPATQNLSQQIRKKSDSRFAGRKTDLTHCVTNLPRRCASSWETESDDIARFFCLEVKV